MTETEELTSTDKVLVLRKNGLNNSEIARMVGCSKENIRQILKVRGIYSPVANLLNRDVEEGMDNETGE